MKISCFATSIPFLILFNFSVQFDSRDKDFSMNIWLHQMFTEIFIFNLDEYRNTHCSPNRGRQLPCNRKCDYIWNANYCINTFCFFLSYLVLVLVLSNKKGYTWYTWDLSLISKLWCTILSEDPWIPQLVNLDITINETFYIRLNNISYCPSLKGTIILRR